MAKKKISTPLGDVYVTSKDNTITSLAWDEFDFLNSSDKTSESSVLFDALEEQLAQYFSGEIRKFTLSVKQSGTPFQEKVWSVISSIDYGICMSYQEIAQKVGSPKASRAVGTACGSNRISILVPCHRVLAANKNLGGYGGGLNRKKKLLFLEKITFKSTDDFVV